METKDYNKEVADRFAEALSLTSISQADLAKEIDILPSRINSYVTGRSEPTVGIFIKLFFSHPKVNWFYVFGGNEYGKIDSISGNMLDTFKDVGLLSNEKIKKLLSEVEALNKDKEVMKMEIGYLKEAVETQKEIVELQKGLLKQLTTQNS